MNIFCCGATTSGKSTATCHDLIQKAEEGKEAIIVCDPHKGSLAWWLLMHLAARGIAQSRVIFDRLSDVRRVVAWNFLERSKKKNALERRAENDERINAMCDVLCRRRGLQGLEQSPLTEEWVRAALTAYVENDVELPFHAISSLLQYGSRIQHLLIDRCTNSGVADKFRGIASGKIKYGQFASASRLIRSVCESPSFQVRCGAGFSLSRFLCNPKKPGILLIEGGSVGNVSFDAMRIVLSSVILKCIQVVRNRRSPFPRINLVIDEASNADLLGVYEIRALAETQKMGLDVTILTQTPNFNSSFVQDAILQNCMRHEWFFCGNASVAQLAARDLGDPALKDELMVLPRGTRYVKEFRRVYKEAIPPLEDPWCFPSLSEKKTEKALLKIQQRPEYQNGESSMIALEQERKSIPVSLTTSLTSSPAERLRTAASRE